MKINITVQKDVATREEADLLVSSIRSVAGQCFLSANIFEKVV